MRVFVALLSLLAANAHAEDTQTLTVAAAANLAAVILPLDAAFEAQHPGTTVKVSTGASGNFFAQIKNGAPFEVFVSADMDFPKKLVEAKLADPATLTHYIDGRLALWTTNPKVDLSRGFGVLATPVVHKIAIANPDLAPYGRAAQAVLAKENLSEKVKDKLVIGENITQTLQFVQTGNADAGFVAFSLLKAPQLQGVGRYELLPDGSYPAIAQGAVVTQKGAGNPLAAAYVTFLSSLAAQKIFADYGYAPPSKP
jgi:molybdate transport system substrate-binding protein